MTPEDFLQFISTIQESENKDKPENYRYVLYARKSTDESEKGHQVRSLPDQLTDVKKYAEHHNINIVKTITEAESAKEPDIRPKFNQMMNDIRENKYDGIITWHPDRLARNMKEAGEIIDLLDKGIIKDLQFASFSFQNTPSGKMLLGIIFVMSKQYSDQLSENIKRGNRNSIVEGKLLGRSKPGYYRDSEKRLQPNGKNYHLIKQAWQMRLENKTSKEISDFLDSNNYESSFGTGGVKHKPVKMSQKHLYKLFSDPTYAGVLIRGKNAVDLTAVYGFQPMITVDEFMKVNKRTERFNKIWQKRLRSREEGSVKADFLRGLVQCGYCLHTMSTGITVKKNLKGIKTQYFYYRCFNKKCAFFNKSVRAKVVVDFVYQFLEQHKFVSKDAYKHYLSEIKRTASSQSNKLSKTFTSLIRQQHVLGEEVEAIKSYLLNEHDEVVKFSFKKDLKVKNDQLVTLDEKIMKINELKDANSKAQLTYNEFVELFENLPDRIRHTSDMRQKDRYIKKLFTNFVVTGKEVTDFELAIPFKDFLPEEKMVYGGR